MVCTTVDGGKITGTRDVVVDCKQNVDEAYGQKLGQTRDLDILCVLLQHPMVVVKFP